MHSPLDSRTQPGRARRTNSPVFQRGPRFIGEVPEKQWEGNQPVYAWRANITGRVEKTFHRAAVAVKPTINPANRPASNQLNRGMRFMQQSCRFQGALTATYNDHTFACKLREIAMVLAMRNQG